MEVKVITAGISYSLQLQQGAWKKVELGASAEIPEGEDWQHAQFDLYTALKTQLGIIWPANERQGATATPPAAQAETVCPHHGKAKGSRDGKNLYCPSKMADDKFCKWTAAKGAK